MSLNSRTINRLLRKIFVGEMPIIKNGYEQQELISSLKSDLKKITGIDVSDSRSSFFNTDSDVICRFSMDDEESRYGFGNSFSVKFNQDNVLTIKHYGDETIIYQIEQIYALIDKLKSEMDNKEARRLKKDKINKLKQQATDRPNFCRGEHKCSP